MELQASAQPSTGVDPATVSFRAEVPEALLASMRGFIEQHPNWDQYRLFQAALAGFLVQNGLKNREVTRCYLANLFPAQASFRGR
jgi:hypothetical protein